MSFFSTTCYTISGITFCENDFSRIFSFLNFFFLSSLCTTNDLIFRIFYPKILLVGIFFSILSVLLVYLSCVLSSRRSSRKLFLKRFFFKEIVFQKLNFFFVCSPIVLDLIRFLGFFFCEIGC